MLSTATRSIVPKIFERCRLETPSAELEPFVPASPGTRRALAAALQLVGGEIRDLVIAGPTGTGKSHLAAGVIAAIVERDTGAYRAARDLVDEREEDARWPAPPYDPAWLNAADAMVRLRLEIGRPIDDRETTDRVLELHRAPGLLVLDDLGREKTSDWTGEVIYALINARYEAELSTIVTTNLTDAGLADSPYWPAISRLAQRGALIRIDDAPDWRLNR